MVDLTRRSFLGARAFGTVAVSSPITAADASPLPTPSARIPAPTGVLTRLPGDGPQLALTVDDGCSTADVAALGRFYADTGMRLTFFVNGVNKSWTDNTGLLQPMISSGQIQLGNHTWSHPDITRISPAALAEQIGRNADFQRNTYGVDGNSVLRPPYGRHNADSAGSRPNTATKPSPCGAPRSVIPADRRSRDDRQRPTIPSGPADRARARQPAPHQSRTATVGHHHRRTRTANGHPRRRLVLEAQTVRGWPRRTSAAPRSRAAAARLRTGRRFSPCSTGIPLPVRLR